MLFLSPVIGCLLKTWLTKGGGHGHPRTPLATPLPHPAVVYISHAWGGRASDKPITGHSQDLIDALKPGEQVMVDRRFGIESILLTRSVELVIPDFEGQDRSQLTEIEGKMSEKMLKQESMWRGRCSELNCITFWTMSSSYQWPVSIKHGLRTTD